MKTLALLALSFGCALGYAYAREFGKVVQRIGELPADEHMRPIDTVIGIASVGIIVSWAIGVIA